MPSWAKTGLTVRLLLKYLLRLEHGLAPRVLVLLSIWLSLEAGAVVVILLEVEVLVALERVVV
jgi:hypothetical protein